MAPSILMPMHCSNIAKAQLFSLMNIRLTNAWLIISNDELWNGANWSVTGSIFVCHKVNHVPLEIGQVV